MARAPLWELLEAHFARRADDADRRAPTTRGSKRCCACARRASRCTATRQPTARAGPQLGGLDPRARAPAAGAGRRRPRLRRGVLRSRPHAGPPRDCRRPLARRPRRARGAGARRGVSQHRRGSRASSSTCRWRMRAVDVVLLSQALHHAAEPARALGRGACASRARAAACWCWTCAGTMRLGARRLGDRWLGFDDEALGTLLNGAGLEDVHVDVGARLTGDPFTVLVASGHKVDGAGDGVHGRAHCNRRREGAVEDRE